MKKKKKSSFLFFFLSSSLFFQKKTNNNNNKLLNGTNSRPIQNNHWDPTDPTDRLQVLTKGPWLGAPIGSVVVAPQQQQQQQSQTQTQNSDTVATPPVLASTADQALLGEAAGSAADTVADLQASEGR